MQQKSCNAGRLQAGKKAHNRIKQHPTKGATQREHPTPSVLALPPRGGPAHSHLVQPARWGTAPLNMSAATQPRMNVVARQGMGTARPLAMAP
jgi:hypothetical protein